MFLCHRPWRCAECRGGHRASTTTSPASSNSSWRERHPSTRKCWIGCSAVDSANDGRPRRWWGGGRVRRHARLCGLGPAARISAEASLCTSARRIVPLARTKKPERAGCPKPVAGNHCAPAWSRHCMLGPTNHVSSQLGRLRSQRATLRTHVNRRADHAMPTSSLQTERAPHRHIRACG